MQDLTGDNMEKEKGKKGSFKKALLTGNYAAAEAMRQINPDVVAAYPITPQTETVEHFAEIVADGLVDTEFIMAESEHSSMSACVGASAAGARAMTATSSQGMALMWEVLGVASGLRLPIVMSVSNRALSSPLNIHCDHSDSMGARDTGWMQLFSENPQEAYENIILAIRLAERANLPAMVMQDGFVTSHCIENVRIYDDNLIREFLGKRKPLNPLLDTCSPVTYGPIQFTDYFFETKVQQARAMDAARKYYIETGKELSKITGSSYNFFDEYETKDAKAVIVTMSSTAGTTKAVVDRMRKEGKRVGLVKVRLFRPFPYNEMAKALKGKSIAVLDRSLSFGAFPPLYSDIKISLSGGKEKIHPYVFGLGGRDIFEKDIENVFNFLLSGKISGETRFIGARE